ncbi:MAG TPA: class I SAM-dependent methyltransferase [Candidatus Bathyarchaeia archaeon]|nr:class I SAM-dependent methyltransferase [Candidatus Bathyarchaeia archaeon]
MKGLDEFFKANKKMWDNSVARNLKNEEIYKTKELLDGKIVLNSIELEELGDVSGKKLLHLQCHFGLDTLSWARLGAIVTGVDFSTEAINLAKSLAKKANLKANFIESNIYDLPKLLDEKYDIVFTSYGVLCWLNDIKEWGRIVSHFLKKGGVFYIAEFHPFIQVFDYDNPNEFELKDSYFYKPEPNIFESENENNLNNGEIIIEKSYEWIHGIGIIITSLIEAGLDIRFMHEFNKAPFPRFQFLTQAKDGYWYFNNLDYELPLIYSIKATKK